ncbi:MAG TPA: aminotransferase class V-fold PLP-dependent enzyme [Oligoflexus sp.]|uniref:aminotransferase class V-fold PLP-dependent enzyme n=1 Tax=Oligoflexus sp. TaxID=1971216 RepID=UPI002D6F6B00|nr:aminotransferase class V-fold PLP-dependent enzyme [Oligoflexus sp.]HYX36366.1 aminotransferase class V-fold PLP-dependent enzyme [Oligoflexus sp.]
MSTLVPGVDPQGLLEYSVVFNDRSLNHMSATFQGIMRSISSTLKQVYAADAVTIVPGGGTYGMEAVARQFATGRRCLVLRNGWFSYRWSQIFEMGSIPAEHKVLKARRPSAERFAPFSPAPLAEVLQAIQTDKPDLVLAPHVETASGIILPDDYIQAVAEAVHAVGGLFILDCIASGTVWVDMKKCGVDILISAPQKGWSASPCSALIMLNKEARQRMETTRSTSFACDLLKWTQIMQAYEAGGHAYHATMPTDALARFHEAMKEAEKLGFASLADQQRELGRKVRALLASRGFASVAAPGFEAPGVVVCYSDDDGLHKGSKFAKVGLQTAAGVPLMCDEPADYKTFRLGLFGLDKLMNIDRTVQHLQKALDQMG